MSVTKIVPLTNVGLLAGAMKRAQVRPAGLPGLVNLVFVEDTPDLPFFARQFEFVDIGVLEQEDVYRWQDGVFDLFGRIDSLVSEIQSWIGGGWVGLIEKALGLPGIFLRVQQLRSQILGVVSGVISMAKNPSAAFDPLVDLFRTPTQIRSSIQDNTPSTSAALLSRSGVPATMPGGDTLTTGPERAANAFLISARLLQVAEANGLWPWVEPDGRLIIGGPDYTTPPVGALVMREDGVGNNVERLAVRRSIANRYSQITVLGQHGQYANDGLDTKRSHLRSQVQDETLARRGIFRPKVVVDSSSESQDMATTRARKLLADSRLEGFEIRAVVKGHRADNGQVWTPGQRVYVRSEPHGLNDIYFLMSRTLRLARGEGAITELRLREDKMWVLDGNKVKKHKGKSNPDAAFIQMIKGL
jgi:hypothetical protein